MSSILNPFERNELEKAMMGRGVDYETIQLILRDFDARTEKIDSLKLQVEFDFDNVICRVTDTERNVSDEYQHYNAFGGCSETIRDISNFNIFIGNCVCAFLDDNNYCFNDGGFAEL